MKNTKHIEMNITSGADSEVMLNERRSIARSTRIMATITVIFCAIVFIYALYIPLSTTYILSCFSQIIVFAGLFLLAYLNKRGLTEYYSTIVIPLWFNISSIIVHGFGETPAIIAFILFAYFLFQKKPKIRFGIILFNIVTHILIIFYLYSFDPLFDNTQHPFDDIGLFILVLGWIRVILKQHEYQNIKLMNTMQIKNQELQHTTEELERFTYIASHDLKSPLRTIISFSDLIDFKIKRKKYDEIAEYVGYVKSGAKQMNFLISDILEISRMNANEELDKEIIDLNKIVQKVSANLTHEIKENNVRLTSSNLQSYSCNETEFILVFQNIIQNGIKYNKSDQPLINISTITTDKELQISISDNGIGMSEEYYETIFQFFKRLHTKEEYEGTGLGLGMTQKIIRKYNGTITVNSEIGIGSTFTIHLPILTATDNIEHKTELIENQ